MPMRMTSLFGSLVVSRRAINGRPAINCPYSKSCRFQEAQNSKRKAKHALLPRFPPCLQAWLLVAHGPTSQIHQDAIQTKGSIQNFRMALRHCYELLKNTKSSFPPGVVWEQDPLRMSPCTVLNNRRKGNFRCSMTRIPMPVELPRWGRDILATVADRELIEGRASDWNQIRDAEE